MSDSSIASVPMHIIKKRRSIMTKFYNHKILLLCLFILLAGMSAGSFFGSAMENQDKLYLSEFLTNHMNGPLFLTFLINVCGLLLIIFAGITVYGFPFALLLLLSRGFATGFCISLLIYTGAFLSICLHILLCLCFMFAAVFSTCYALQHLHITVR